MLECNMKAPDFTLTDDQGHPVSLHDFAGRKVILYFYSKDNTSGCTLQAQTYRDVFEDLEKTGAVLIGISKDTWRTHANFKKKHDLPFMLLADPERSVHEAYGVLKEKTMYGKKVIGTLRTTFVIDENGMIEQVFEKVKPAQDAGMVLEYLHGGH